MSVSYVVAVVTVQEDCFARVDVGVGLCLRMCCARMDVGAQLGVRVPMPVR